MKNEINVLWIIPQKRGTDKAFHFVKRGLDEYANAGVNITVYPYYDQRSLIGSLRSILEIHKVIRKKKINLVHAHYGSTTGLLALLTGHKYVTTFRGTDVNGESDNYLKSKLVWIFSNIAARFSEQVICVSSQLAAKLILSHDTLNIIPSGIPTNMFKPIDQKECRKQLGLESRPKLVAFASSQRRPLKRYDLAVEVIKKLQALGHSVELLELSNISEEKIPKYLNSSDCLILLSDNEGSPNIVREALACGIPIVSFDVGDVRKWLSFDRFSYVCSTRDLNEFTKAVEKVLLNPPTNRMQRVDVSLFSAETMARKVVEVYRKIK